MGANVNLPESYDGIDNFFSLGISSSITVDFILRSQELEIKNAIFGVGIWVPATQNCLYLGAESADSEGTLGIIGKNGEQEHFHKHRTVK